MRRRQQELRVDMPPRPKLLSRRSWTALAVYVLMSAGALLWAHWQNFPLVRTPEARQPAHTLSLLLGCLVAAITIAGTRWAVPRVSWFRRLHRDFRDLLGPLQRREILVFAVSSGIAEELLFRGAMLPAVGLVGSSLIFGGVHIAPRPPRWVWPLWAAVMGLVFGSLYELTGSLYGPIVGHVLINLVNLHYIDRFDPGSVPSSEPASSAASPAIDPGRSRSS